LSANKYFYIFKMAIESKLPRLVEQLLYRIQKLFSYDFLDGDCPDNCRYEEGQQPPAKNGKRNRLLIDAIVETICKCSEDRDNAVQLEVIKVGNTHNNNLTSHQIVELFILFLEECEKEIDR